MGTLASEHRELPDELVQEVDGIAELTFSGMGDLQVNRTSTVGESKV
jgi:hypothetical protein